MNLINIRDGGVNGVKLTWDEGETQYEVERGVEVYERLKSHPAVAAWNPLSVGIAYAMIDRITQDKTPLITVNHGRTDSTDGRVFPYVFPLLLNPYSETSGIVNYIASKLGGLDNLKGKKIVVLYHGSPYGKETIPIYELLAQKYGFEVQQIEVPHPGVEQQSQWLTIRRAKPDYVVLRGWGVMNPVALEDGGEGRLPRRSHRRQCLVEFGGRRDPRRRRGDRLHRDHHPGLGPAISDRAGDREDGLWRGQGQSRRQEPHRLASITTSASSTASSMSRRSGSRRRSSAIAR